MLEPISALAKASLIFWAHAVTLVGSTASPVFAPFDSRPSRHEAFFPIALAFAPLHLLSAAALPQMTVSTARSASVEAADALVMILPSLYGHSITPVDVLGATTANR